MSNQYKFTPIPPKEELERLYNAGLNQTELGQHFGVTQKVIWGWFKKLNIQSRIAYKRNQWGEKNHMWKGEEATYQAKHHWIEKQKGKPRICQHCGTTKGIFEWANIGHKYNRDVNEWIRLCRKHHRQMDLKSLSVLRNYSLESEGSD